MDAAANYLVRLSETRVALFQKSGSTFSMQREHESQFPWQAALDLKIPTGSEIWIDAPWSTLVPAELKREEDIEKAWAYCFGATNATIRRDAFESSMVQLAWGFPDALAESLSEIAAQSIHCIQAGIIKLALQGPKRLSGLWLFAEPQRLSAVIIQRGFCRYARTFELHAQSDAIYYTRHLLQEYTDERPPRVLLAGSQGARLSRSLDGSGYQVTEIPDSAFDTLEELQQLKQVLD